MIFKVFSVFDSKAAYYSRPFFAKTTGEAIRLFEDSVRDKDSLFSKHPLDFTLFELGIFDDSNGLFDSLAVPNPLGTGNDFLVE